MHAKYNDGGLRGLAAACVGDFFFLLWGGGGCSVNSNRPARRGDGRTPSFESRGRLWGACWFRALWGPKHQTPKTSNRMTILVVYTLDIHHGVMRR